MTTWWYLLSFRCTKCKYLQREHCLLLLKSENHFNITVWCEIHISHYYYINMFLLQIDAHEWDWELSFNFNKSLLQSIRIASCNQSCQSLLCSFTKLQTILTHRCTPLRSTYTDVEVCAIGVVGAYSCQ